MLLWLQKETLKLTLTLTLALALALQQTEIEDVARKTIQYNHLHP